MLNPVFLFVILITTIFSICSLKNWKLGLLVFFTYTQFFGIIKRIILSIGLDNLSYNVLVASQYLFLFSVIAGALLQHGSRTISFGKVNIWIAAFTLMLLSSILLSPFGPGIAVTLCIIQFFPVFIILAGKYLEERQIEDLKKLFIRTAPIHALYQIYQFYFGPFGFELNFIDAKSSVVNSFDGDFLRGIPLYDSVDPLYIHFTLAFLLLLKGNKTVYSWINLLLIIVALILIGNRSGLMILFLGVFVWMILEWKIPQKRLLLSSIVVLVVVALNIFGLLLMDVIQTIESVNISQSDLGARWGSLGTYADRIIGRQNASANVTVFGLGLGSSGLAVTTLANKGLDFDGAGSDLYAHDLVGEILLDFGIFGLFIFALLIIALLRSCISNKEDAVFLAMILASIMASSLLGGSFTYGRAGYFVFLFAGYLLHKSDYSKPTSVPIIYA